MRCNKDDTNSFQVLITTDEARFMCRPCRQKLIDFYEYYNFVLENQVKYHSIEVQEESKSVNNLTNEIPTPDVIFLMKEEMVTQNPVEEISVVKSTAEIKIEPSILSEVEQNEKPVTVKTTKRKRKRKSDGDPDNARPRGRPTKPKTDEQLKYMAEDAAMQKYFKLKCEKCKVDKEFSRYRDLHFHMRKRHNAPVVMECCGIKLLSRINTVRHCNDHDSPTNCDDCNESFAGRQVLRKHMADVHNKKIPLDDRVFVCNECGKTKVEKKNILHHLKAVHFSPNSFCCEICAVVYKTLVSLERHINVEHKQIKLPRSQCEHCGKWIQERHYSTHIKNHFTPPEPVTCDTCGRECKSKKLLQKHNRKHHSPWSKKHQCSYCPKTFTEIICLREHMATHTGVSLYHCEFCGAQFKSNGNYSAHKRRLHPVEYGQQKLENRIKREQAAAGQNSNNNKEFKL